MKPEEVTLYSGGARGAEETFGQQAEIYHISEVNFTFEGHHIRRAKNTQWLSAEDLAKSDVSMAEVAKRLNRDFSARPWMRQILQSIWHQVNNGYQVFVVGTILEDDTVKGGTGWAAELAKMFNRPLHAFDQERGHWFTWTNGTWVEDLPLISHASVCGTGTRQMNDAGRRAVEELFARSFRP